MSHSKIKAVRKIDEGLGEEAEVRLELVCGQHDEAGVRVFINPATEQMTVLCRECLGEVASSTQPAPPPARSSGRVH